MFWTVEKWNRTNFIGTFSVCGRKHPYVFPNKQTFTTHQCFCCRFIFYFLWGHFLCHVGIFFLSCHFFILTLVEKKNSLNRIIAIHFTSSLTLSLSQCVQVYLFDWSQVAFATAIFLYSSLSCSSCCWFGKSTIWLSSFTSISTLLTNETYTEWNDTVFLPIKYPIYMCALCYIVLLLFWLPFSIQILSISAIFSIVERSCFI